jgi:hypothetical protein
VFIAETGGFDLINTANRVTKQPYNGVFFTSANASTWTPEQTKDLKFTLYRANFTSNSATVVLTNDDIPPRTLKNNPFRYVSNSTNTIIRVTHPNHGMYGANNKVIIGNQTGTVNGITAAQMNITHDISNIETDSYSITIASVAATAIGIDGGGVGITATENNQYNTLVPQIQTLEVPNTAISYTLEAQTGKSIDGAESAYTKTAIGGILANGNNEFTNPFTIASPINESTYTSDSSAGNKSLVLTATLTGNSFISPVIDMNRASVITVSNRLNDATTNSSAYNTTAYGQNYVADTVANGTSNLNRYITKRVDLNNEAEVLDVYINANKPSGSNIDLYYKVLEAGSDADFESLTWTLLSPDEIIITDDSGGYNEVHYQKVFASKFGSFAFKLVFRSSNTSNVPTLKDFRAIAAT